MNTQSTVDVRSIPGPERHPTIFRTFDALAAGDAFVLVNDHYPQPLLFQFMAVRPGAFEWNVLEAGPGLFRVHIQKRAESGGRGVSEYLETDHRRLDELMTRADRELAESDFRAATATFSEFACGLERHMQAEELVLFPSFEQVTGMVGGPTVVMNREHALLREIVTSVFGALRAENSGAAREALQSLRALLEQHNAKEEGIIYPRTDRALADEENDELVRRMQAL